MALFEICKRCNCCSTNQDGTCYGSCLECGHHAECQNCIDNRKNIEQFMNLIDSFSETLKDLLRKIV